MEEKTLPTESRKASSATSNDDSRDPSQYEAQEPVEPAELEEAKNYEGHMLGHTISNQSAKSHRSTLSRAVSAFSDPTTHIRDPGPPPDGGAKAWTQAFMSHFVICSTWGYISSFGVFQTYYETTLGVSASAISWVGSVQIFLLFAVSTFTGRALDAGYFRLVFGCGCVLQLIGVFTTSVSKTYWQLFLSQGLATGLGNGLQFCPTVALVSTYFSKKKSLAIAIGASGSATGGMVFPAIVRQLLPQVGFGWTVRTLGFVILALDMATFSVLRTRLPPRRSGAIVEWSAFKEKTYLFYVFGMFFNFWGLYFAFYYVGAFARRHTGLSYQNSIDLLILMNGVGMIGRLLPAYLADKYAGPLNLLLPVTAGCAILLYCWAAVHDRPGLYAFACFYGFVAAGIQSLWPATLASLTTDLTKVGTRTGMGFTIVSFATLTGSPLGGALIGEDNGNYLYAQMWGASTFAVGLILLLIARVCKSGWVWKYRV